MRSKIKTRKPDTDAILLRSLLILIPLKILVVSYSFGYLFPQLGSNRTLYFFLLMGQGDALLIGTVFLLRYIQKYSHYRRLHILSNIMIRTIGIWFLMDILALASFQQRFSFTQTRVLFSWTDNVVWRYGGDAILILGLLIGIIGLAGHLLKPKLSVKGFSTIISISFLYYFLPLPSIQLATENLPLENVFSHGFKKEILINLSAPETLPAQKNQQTDTFKPNTGEQNKEIQKRKAIAETHPEKIFKTFPDPLLIKATEQDPWMLISIIETAVQKEPELAFRYLDRYQYRESTQHSSITKAILKKAIANKPELAFSELSRYENLIIDNQKIAKELLSYAASQYQNKLSLHDLYHPVPGRANTKNIILLFRESASAVDSKAFGGIHNRFPLTDNILKDGVQFQNMLANGWSSDMGHVAVLQGVEPINLGKTQNVYESYTGTTSGLASFFNELGYQSFFISTASLDFLNQRSFLKKVGFQQIIEKGFERRHRYTFNAAPDEALYQKTLQLIKKQQAPYFIALQSISSHTPYSTPYGNTTEAMYRYIDESFAKFYEELKKTDFFENGILLVVSDHRKITPLETEEFAKRGQEASSKIIAFMIGKDIPANTIDDKRYQQTDIFSSLKKEFWRGMVNILSLSNDIFTQETHKDRGLKHFPVHPKVHVFGTGGRFGYIDTNTMQFVSGKEHFPAEALLNYLRLSRDFQMQSTSEKTQNTSNQIQTSPKSQKANLIAHRGAHQTTTENSFEAFEKASKLWAYGLEFDVSSTKDGQLVIFHGPKIFNHTQCHTEQRDICEIPRSELQKCLLKNGEKIWLLSEMLPKMKGLFPLFFLDFKTSENPNCEHEDTIQLQKIKNLLLKNDMQEQVVLSSYHPLLTKQLSKENQIFTAIDTFAPKDLRLAPKWNYRYFMAPHNNFTPAFLEILKNFKNTTEQELIPVAYVVNTPELMDQLLKQGINHMMTDNLETLLQEQK